MTNFLDLPKEILDKINEMVLKEQNKDILKYWFFEWKEMVTYYSGGKYRICF